MISLGRSMASSSSSLRSSAVEDPSTTTMKVVDRDLDPETYFALIADGLESQGYVTNELMANPNVNQWVHDLTDELIYLAAVCPVGTVVERRGDILAPRAPQHKDV